MSEEQQTTVIKLTDRIGTAKEIIKIFKAHYKRSKSKASYGNIEKYFHTMVGYCSQMEIFIDEWEELRNEVKKFATQRGDDRCFLDDQRLAKLVDVEINNSMPSKEKFLANCERYYDKRCKNADWPSYQELEEKLEEFINVLDLINLKEMNCLSQEDKQLLVLIHEDSKKLLLKREKVSLVDLVKANEPK